MSHTEPGHSVARGVGDLRDPDHRQERMLQVLRPFLTRVPERQALVGLPVSLISGLGGDSLNRFPTVRLRVAALRMRRLIVRGLWLLPVSVQCFSGWSEAL